MLLTATGILSLALSNYQIQYSPDHPLSERVIFPHSPSEINGIEDARFVEFYDQDGQRTYYATYSAYDGKVVFPQLLETKDFLQFRMSTLNGPEVKNKGMALFPRKINGHYAMISRQDNENIYLMYSEHLHFWYTKQLILKPTYPWEFVQLGNCGSPIETEAGWLVLSHGVGAMREYSIGAFLLDKDDPSIVIGRLEEPLLTPNENEREGYVPNVVYSCGGAIHGDELIIPYAMSDHASSIAKVSVSELLNKLTNPLNNIKLKVEQLNIIRYGKNPILTKENVPFKVNSIFNPGAVKYKNKYILLCRVEMPIGRSSLIIAESSDGYNFKVASKLTLTPEDHKEFNKYTVWGIEDARITPIENKFYLTYTGYSKYQPLVILTETSDFINFKIHGPISEPSNKDCALFPEKIDGYYWKVDRPSAENRRDIWISRSPDLIHWGGYKILQEPETGTWEQDKIGSSSNPIKTKDGWLMLYHGVRSYRYGFNL